MTNKIKWRSNNVKVEMTKRIMYKTNSFMARINKRIKYKIITNNIKVFKILTAVKVQKMSKQINISFNM
jgi:hypothetical protein